jgi:hypothetical protein
MKGAMIIKTKRDPFKFHNLFEYDESLTKEEE